MVIMVEHSRKFMAGAWIFLLMVVTIVVASKSVEETSKGEDPQEDSKAGGIEATSDVTESVIAKVIVGTEEGRRKGRVEEQQLFASAKLFNYDIQIQSNAEVPCEGEDDSTENYILIFLPRAEGIITAPVESLKKALQETSADILLPFANVNALVGWSRSVHAAAKAMGVTSLTSLAEKFHASPKLCNQHNVKTNIIGSVLYVLDDLSSVGNQDLKMTERDGRYELQFKDHAPCILLALPNSSHASALLLAISDYLVGTHHPTKGCVSCKTIDNMFSLNVTHLVMVGVFITHPQPFLEETLAPLIHHGLNPNNTHFFIYNQVEEYKHRVEIFVQRLREDGKVRNITLLQASGSNMGIANIKNMAIKECLRLGCHWYVNVDSYTFINAQLAAVLVSLDQAVVTANLRVQTWMPATFWREIDATSSSPTYSWDHAKILEGAPNMRGYWHASCIRGIYAIRHDILTRLSEPYTHTHKVPLTHPHPDPDLAFCAALREDGIPMIATSAFPNSGVLVNTTHYKGTDTLRQYTSNPVMWTVTYIHPDLQSVLSGDMSVVKRPCHEVYEFPVFKPMFGFDVAHLANKVNKWSPAVKMDPRKQFGIEPVPTVDQWFSQLGLEDLLADLYTDLLRHLQKIAFPFQNVGNSIPLSLVARFQPDEQPGLPQHHDSSIITYYMNLTPKDDYKGGEVEFPAQECRVKSEVGHLLMFPSRLSHPKILHNVTEGILHKAIMFTSEGTNDPVATGNY